MLSQLLHRACAPADPLSCRRRLTEHLLRVIGSPDMA